MTNSGITFPQRPMKVSPPSSGILSQLNAVLWPTVCVCIALKLFISQLPDLVSDFAMRNTARPLAGATVQQSTCNFDNSDEFWYETTCDATLLARRQGLPEIRREVHFWFTGRQSKNYAMTVVADPAQPEKMTTNLALDKLWNRTWTLLAAEAGLLLLGLPITLFLFRSVHKRRSVVRALSNQVLRQTLLRLDERSYYGWIVSSRTPRGAWKSCDWDTTNTPIIMKKNLVLGVTTGDGTMCMPLDTTLAWLDLTDAERTQMLEQIGPERLHKIDIPEPAD